MVSTLFTECQNSTPFCRFDQFNFRGFDFYIGKRGVFSGDFFTFLPTKSSILMLKAPNLSERLRLDRPTKNLPQFLYLSPDETSPRHRS